MHSHEREHMYTAYNKYNVRATRTHLYSLLCKFVERLALRAEDLDVGAEQVLTLHALFARHCTNEDRGV